MGLHRVENPSAINPAVSLHLYSPPFSSCSVFNKQTGQKSTCTVTFWSKYGERRNRQIQDARSPEDN
ncbi:PREDICTED: cysteine dioxygenase type 1-like [Wasmannia auropunctata]|nr:PREDICTED: cysteine dioxygenase type 1-like [Wasmannia auropunctata]